MFKEASDSFTLLLYDGAIFSQEAAAVLLAQEVQNL